MSVLSLFLMKSAHFHFESQHRPGHISWYPQCWWVKSCTCFYIEIPNWLHYLVRGILSINRSQVSTFHLPPFTKMARQNGQGYMHRVLPAFCASPPAVLRPMARKALRVLDEEIVFMIFGGVRGWHEVFLQGNFGQFIFVALCFLIVVDSFQRYDLFVQVCLYSFDSKNTLFLEYIYWN